MVKYSSPFNNLAIEKNISLIDELFNQYPGNPRITIEAAKFLISLNRFEDATKLLDTIPPSERAVYSQAQGVKALIHFKQEAENQGESELDKSYAEACRLTLASEYDRALQLFLEILGTSRKYKDDGARKAMLSIFNLLGDDNPLTQQYRKELMLQLY